jgi:hypothetical protein
VEELIGKKQTLEYHHPSPELIYLIVTGSGFKITRKILLL